MNTKPIFGQITISLAFFFVLTCSFVFFAGIYTISPFPNGKPVLIIEDEVFSENTPFIIENDNVLLSYNIIKEKLDPYIFYDSMEDKIIITTRDKTVLLSTENLTAMINAKPVSISFPVKAKDGMPYIPIRILQDLYNIKVGLFPEQNRVVIDKNFDTRSVGKLLVYKTNIKKSPSWFSANVTKITKSNRLSVYALEDGWYRVRTEDGIIGYIPEKKLEVFNMPEISKENSGYQRYNPNSQPLNMVWDYVHSTTPDMTGKTAPEGLDIISPTWFSIIDGQGTIESRADISYVEWAHKNNLAVWALINNNFDPDMTHQFLSSSISRDRIIRQILMYAELFHLDGINIDFENVYLADKGLLVQFMRELTPILHEAGITVSMDITVKSTSPNWSLCYDRKELGKIVDYLMLMAYDEHWATSPVSGSVASIGWVEKGIKTLLEDVPAEKVFLGLPFYTRLWQETADENGTLKVKSRTLSMAQVKQIIQQHHPEIRWDSKAGQNFAIYKKGNSIYKIWLEDEKSINLKASLIKKYGLAGAAAWRRGFEKAEIWEVLYKVLKAPSNV